MYFSEIPKNLEVNIISEGVPSNWLNDINNGWLHYNNLLGSASISNDGLELFRFNPVSKKDPNRNYKLKNIQYYHFKDLYKKDTPIKKIAISNSGFKISMNMHRYTGRNYTSRAVIELTNPEIDALNLGYRFWIDISFQELRDLLGTSSGILEKGCKFTGTYKIAINKTGCYPEYSLVRESDFEYKEPSNISYSIKLGESLYDKRTRDLKVGNLYLLKNRMGAFICLGSAQNISLISYRYRLDYGYPIDDFTRKIRKYNKSSSRRILDDAIIVYNIPSVEMFCHIIDTSKFLKDKQIDLHDLLSIVTSSSHVRNESLIELLEGDRIYAIDVKEANSLFYDFGKIFNLKTSTISILDQIKDFVKDQYLRIDLNTKNAEELITTVSDIFPEFKEFQEEKFYLGFISSKATVYRQLVRFMQQGSPNLTSEQIYDVFKTIDSTEDILNHFAQKTLSTGLYNYYLTDTNLLKQDILSSQPNVFLGRNLEKEDWIKIFNKCLDD